MSKINMNNVTAYALGAVKQLANAGVLGSVVLTSFAKAQPFLAAWLAKIAAGAALTTAATAGLIVAAGLVGIVAIKGLNWLLKKVGIAAQATSAKVTSLFNKNKDVQVVASNDGVHAPMAAAA